MRIKLKKLLKEFVRRLEAVEPLRASSGLLAFFTGLCRWKKKLGLFRYLTVR